MEYRTISRTEIFYLILIDEYPNNLPFLYPENVDINSLHIIQFLPKNLLQLKNPETFAQYQFNSTDFNPYRVIFYKRSDKIEIEKFLNQNKNLKILLADSNEDSDWKEKIEKKEYSLTKFIDYASKNTAEQIDTLLYNLVFDLENVFLKLGLDFDPEEGLNVNVNYSKLKSFQYFKPSKTNFLRYNSLIGNFTNQFKPIEDEEYENKVSKAINARDSFQRLNIFLEQLKAFDFLHEELKVERHFLPYKIGFHPLFISLPFHNPDLKDFFDGKFSKEVKRKVGYIQVEQTTNFINTYSSPKKDHLQQELVEIHAASHFTSAKLSYLDNICFLLSSFKDSPYVRFPIIGKSIYRELSFMAPKNFHKYLSFKSQFKISDNILKIGEKLKSKILNKEFENYIINRNSQIVAVSDFPLEWLNLGGVPLCFTHDVTRIPETTHNNLLNSFAANSLIDFAVTEDVITKTLVIIGTDDEKFLKWHSLIFDLSNKQGFKVEICLSNAAFINTIKKFKPDFLIIDSHAKFDEQTKQTYLELGEDRLTNEVIEANFISIPLIFISACGTAPIYGTFNPIVNSFISMGSKSVTCTFLPVEIDNSTMVYLTILNNLNNVSRKGSFHNWLEYISYSVRSAFLHRTFTPIINDDKKYEKPYHDMIQQILYFEERAKVYKSVRNIQKTLPKKVYQKNKAKAYEFLYYTNIGRADLVLFKKYKEAFE